jgi:hypothetical protein
MVRSVLELPMRRSATSFKAVGNVRLQFGKLTQLIEWDLQENGLALQNRRKEMIFERPFPAKLLG